MKTFACIHRHHHTTTLTEWTLAAGSAEGMPNLQVKRTSENDMQSECFSVIYTVCRIVYSKFKEYYYHIHLLVTSFYPVNIQFKDCDVCVCIIASDVLAACKWQ